jgi:hypothetical protein
MSAQRRCPAPSANGPSVLETAMPRAAGFTEGLNGPVTGRSLTNACPLARAARASLKFSGVVSCAGVQRESSRSGRCDAGVFGYRGPPSPA